MALQPVDSLTQRFLKTSGILAQMQPGSTFSGYAQAQLRHGAQTLFIAQQHLAFLVHQVARDAGLWRMAGFVPIAVDGSRVKAAKSKSNDTGLKLKGRLGTSTPQAWITSFLHLPTGLVWRWVVDRGDAAERNHLKQVLRRLPRLALIIADAGYCGYDLWMAILGHKKDFLIRVGSNVRLIARLARAQGYQARLVAGTQTVWLWPKNKRQEMAPIMLRLIVIHNGKHPVYLITNVLDAHRLSDQQVTTFYRMRWGIELWFRSLKQTMGMTKLASHSPNQALLELNWAAMARAVLGLIHAKALILAGQSPLAASCKKGLDYIRLAIDGATVRPRTTLHQSLAKAVKDIYLRKSSKAARSYPVQKKYEKTGPPLIIDATDQECLLYQQLMATHKP